MAKDQPDFTQLRLLLEDEVYPHEYIHKFIGRNSPPFNSDVEALERAYGAKLRLRNVRLSAGDAHVAMTYILEARTAEEIIELLKATYALRDVLMVL